MASRKYRSLGPRFLLGVKFLACSVIVSDSESLALPSTLNYILATGV